jgi:DNA-binding NarL/FixJ family response regulator
MINSLMLASSSQDRLNTWKQELNDFVSTSLLVDKLGSLRDEIIRTKPQVLLLDFDLLVSNGSNDVAGLRRLCVETRTIIMHNGISENLEWELLKAGIRGCCQNDLAPKILKHAVTAVQKDELWIRRTLASRLIDELGKTTSKNKAYRAALGLLNTLTQREFDIATRVGNGESNKQIAQACEITERTVKAHLTSIYFKLSVSDRLNLALVMSSDNRSALLHSDSLLNGGSRVNDSKL